MTTDTKEKEARYFDFNNGAILSNRDIIGMHQDTLEKIRNGADAYSTSCGRVMVIGKKITFSYDPDNPVIQIIQITNGYEKYEYPFPNTNTNEQPQSYETPVQ